MGLLRKINQVLGNFTTHNGVIVLTYHRINNRLAKDALVVHPRDFKTQMRFLSFYKKQFQVIGLEELIDWFNFPQDAGKGKKPRTKILITFDDGYRDNYIHAFPILKRYKFSATIFLTTNYIGTSAKKERYQDVPWKRDYLNSSEINEMIKSNITFGAHTATHPHLTQLTLAEVEKEIEESRITVSRLTGTHSIAFCYPYGEYIENIKDMVKNSGFSCAFTVKPGINDEGQDPFELKRIDVTGQDNFSSFKYKITEKYI